MKAIALAAALVAGGAAMAQTPWPTLESPSGARRVVVSPEVVLNGERSRIEQVDARSSVEDMLDHYRRQLGAQRVEHKLGDAMVVASRHGVFFHTVQVRRLGLERAQATLITTAPTATPSRSAALQDTRSWLPVDSRTQQTQESDDGGVRSVTVVASNTLGVQANRDLLVQAMAQRGLNLVREHKPDAQATAGREGLALMAASREEQVLVTVLDTGARRAVSIVRTREIQGAPAR